MASGTTTIWGRPYPVTGDAPAVHTDIQALANSLETTPLTPTTATSSRTGVNGESVAVSPSQTLTLPSSPTKGNIIQIIALGTVTGATPVTVAAAGGKQINGVGLSAATSFPLGTGNASATLQYDGTAWRVIAGAQDSGWVAVTIGSGLTADGTAFVPAARLKGDEVRLRGILDASAGLSVNSTLATIPSVARPSGQVGAAVIYAEGAGKGGSVDTSGVLRNNVGTTISQAFYLDPIVYSLA